ncbi:MAG: hypothetical protein CSA24_02045 [Deltaproteobacteria bacterium]|nr:MAG: hypothetical protein CSA24_02045 [Deltaproteobacteria bacterium]
MSEIVGAVFLLQRLWTYSLDGFLEPFGLTTRQWMLLAAVDQLFEEPPPLQVVADRLNTSHQNVKAMALQLQRRGLVEIVGDKADKRVKRLQTTESNRELWAAMAGQTEAFIAGLFDDLEDAELSELRGLMGPLYARAIERYRDERARRSGRR